MARIALYLTLKARVTHSHSHWLVVALHRRFSCSNLSFTILHALHGGSVKLTWGSRETVGYWYWDRLLPWVDSCLATPALVIANFILPLLIRSQISCAFSLSCLVSQTEAHRRSLQVQKAEVQEVGPQKKQHLSQALVSLVVLLNVLLIGQLMVFVRKLSETGLLPESEHWRLDLTEV